MYERVWTPGRILDRILVSRAPGRMIDRIS